METKLPKESGNQSDIRYEKEILHCIELALSDRFLIIEGHYDIRPLQNGNKRVKLSILMKDKSHETSRDVSTTP